MTDKQFSSLTWLLTFHFLMLVALVSVSALILGDGIDKVHNIVKTIQASE